LRQLLVHRMKLVRTRTAVKNQLHALAISQGLCRKHKLWTEKGRAELEGLALGPWASRRRKELLEMLDQLDAAIEPLDRAVEQEARARAEAVRLMTHPGVGPVVSLAMVLTLGPVERFPNSRKLVSYLGLNPRESSSGGRQRLGAISKQGNSMMRWLLVEAAHRAVVHDPELRRAYPTPEVSPGERGGEGRHGPPPGGSSVLDAARADQLRAAGSHVRQPE
jgi:transposase